MERTRLVAVLGSMLAGAAAAGSGPPEPEKVPLWCVREEHDFTLADLRGQSVAVHLLGRAAEDRCVSLAREYAEHWPEVAGVTHVFVAEAAPSAVQAWGGEFKGEPIMIVSDAPGRLARALNIEGGDRGFSRPALVVLDPSGAELFRHVGSGADDHPGFAAFARLMEEKSAAPALAEYNLPRGKPIAVEGYDVVAYFDPGVAVAGRAELSSRYRGVTYRFSTEEHRRRFARDPEKFLPTYGGWCASAMGAKGTKVEIDPRSFKVKDGRLFLFYRSMFADALKDWNRNEKAWEPAADANWKKLSGEDPIRPRR